MVEHLGEVGYHDVDDEEGFVRTFLGYPYVSQTSSNVLFFIFLLIFYLKKIFDHKPLAPVGFIEA